MMSWLFFAFLFALSKSAEPPTYGTYGPCTHKTVKVGGYVAGGSQDAVLMYPTASIKNKTTLPFIAFAHGMTLGGVETYTAYVKLWNEVCSYGYIIAGPTSCPEAYCQKFYKDVITTITTMSSKKSEIDPALAYADFSKIGVYGHSMGGAATVHVSDQKDLKIIASVAMHPAVTADDDKQESADVAVPMIWFTGSSDLIVPPEGVYNGYKADKHLPKIFAEIKGATHMDRLDAEGPYIGEYFDCMIRGSKVGCSYFFTGGKDNICTGGMAMTKCYIDGNNTMSVV